MKGIDVQFIEHREQRYNTIGDWWIHDGVLHVRISRLPLLSSMVAVAVHEIVEAILCYLAGIEEYRVSAFDAYIERNKIIVEPGDHPRAPYHLQHGFATACERIIVAAAGTNWHLHESSMDDVCRTWELGPKEGVQ